MRRPVRIVLRVTVTAVLSLAVFAGVATAGVAVTMSTSYRTAASASVPAPPARPAPPDRLKVAVVVGATGSVVSDVLMPYDVFARSDRFFVYVTAARRTPHALSGGLQVVPEYTFADAPKPDVVIVPAVIDPTGSQEAPLRSWITAQAASGAHVLGVCSGAKVLAAAGLLDRRKATTFWAALDPLRRAYPSTTWLAGRRYVDDGPVTTTAGVTSGVAGALHLVDRLAGTAEANRVGRDVAYPGWDRDDQVDIPVRHYTLSDAPYALNAAFPWLRPTVGIGLVDSVAEIDVAAAFEAYAGTSSASRTIAVGASSTVTTRHGMTLITEPLAAEPAVDRLVLPGQTSTPHWARRPATSVDLPHADRRPGEFSLNPVLRDLATHTDQATARTTAKFVEYPADGLRLTGARWPWRSTLLAMLALALAVGSGLALPATAAALHRRWTARRRAATP